MWRTPTRIYCVQMKTEILNLHFYFYFCRLTTSELADMESISNGSADTILKDVLGLRKVKSRIITKSFQWFFVSFSPKMQPISFRNHPIRLIWLRVTSGYLVNSKDPSADIVLSRLRRLKENCWRRWSLSRKATLRHVTRSGNYADISPLRRVGTTLKWIKSIWKNK